MLCCQTRFRFLHSGMAYELPAGAKWASGMAGQRPLLQEPCSPAMSSRGRDTYSGGAYAYRYMLIGCGPSRLVTAAVWTALTRRGKAEVPKMMKGPRAQTKDNSPRQRQRREPPSHQALRSYAPATNAIVVAQRPVGLPASRGVQHTRMRWTTAVTPPPPPPARR